MRESSREMEFQHFFHKHPLSLDRSIRHGVWAEVNCNGCNAQVWKDYYYCRICLAARGSGRFNLCRSCFKLPREIQHPFHEHVLTLVPKPHYISVDPSDDGSASCTVCSNKCEGFIFHCYKCEFEMDLNCYTLMPTANNKKSNYYRTSVEEKELEERHVTHPHPLIRCYRENEKIDFPCRACQLSITGVIYACLDCGCLLDKSCAQLPQQISHPFHPQHPLTLKSTRKDGIYYFCPDDDCYYNLDVRHASMMPNPSDDDDDEQVAFTHRNPLIPCYATNQNFKFNCYACEFLIEEATLYFDVKWPILLHKSCAELPRVIQHPFHPPHPLELRDNYFIHKYECKACESSGSGFSYWCGKCEFAMHVTCASRAYTTIKLLSHEHPLAFIKYNNSIRRINAGCQRCKKSWGFPFLGCVPCGFSIRLCCLSHILPPTFKHSDHAHSIIYTEECIKQNEEQDSDDEFYCDSCEKIRSLKDPTYYCEECPFVAEVSCVFDEILKYLREKQLSLAPGPDDQNYTSLIAARDKEVVLLKSQLKALVSEEVTLQGEWEELMEWSEKDTASFESEMDWLTAKENKLIAERVRLNSKWDELANIVGGYPIGEIPSLGIGTKSSVTIVDDYEDVVVEDREVRSMDKENEDDHAGGTCSSTSADQDEEVMKSKLEELKKKRDEEIEALTANLEALKRKSDEEIEALTANLEALKMKRGDDMLTYEKDP